MNQEFTSAVTRICPKDGIHFSLLPGCRELGAIRSGLAVSVVIDYPDKGKSASQVIGASYNQGLMSLPPGEPLAEPNHAPGPYGRQSDKQ